MFKASNQPYTFKFNFPAGTSRGVLSEKQSWFLKLWNTNNPGKVGVGEISIIPGLSPESPELIEQYLYSFCQNPESLLAQFDHLNHPAIKFGIETALIDLNNEGRQILFPSKFTEGQKGIQINGLIWMGNKSEMLLRLKEKVNAGFKCIKIKVGSIDFEEELSLLKYIRESFTEQDVEIRVDANGAFEPNEALQKIELLSKFNIHSIEQPIKQGQYDEMAKLCQATTIPIALDEELIGIHEKLYKKQLLEYIRPQYIILKPSLVGGLFETNEWGQLANEMNIGWWVTSALEGNIGLNAIAQWTFVHGSYMPQGLGTGQVFSNNIESPLEIKGQELWYNSKIGWDVSYDPNPIIRTPPQGGDDAEQKQSDRKQFESEAKIEEKKQSTANDRHATQQSASTHYSGEIRGWNDIQSIKINNISYDLQEINWDKLKAHYSDQWWQDIVLFLQEWNNSSNSVKIKTSGTTGKPKSYKIEKQKFLVSASKTCEFFNLSENTTGLLCLSANYIAGKMMLVRALLSGMNLICVKPSNNPLQSINSIIDYTAMVPMQVKKCIARPSFKLIKNLIIGGGKVEQNLINKLQQTNTRAYETFGMTETLSHIALKELSPQKAEHFKALSGISLLKSYNNELIIDYPELGIYKLKTNDLIELINDNGCFKWLGRSDFAINSGGVKIYPEEVEKLIEPIIQNLYCVVGVPDLKLGEKAILVIEGEPFDTQDLMNKMRKSLPSYYLPKEVKFVHKIPLTDSGKIQRKKIFKPKTYL